MEVGSKHHIRSEMRKRWIYILPAVFVTYSLAYLDRANYGFGAAAGLAATLQISNARAALLGSLFFLAYFLFQVPGAVFAQRRRARYLVFFALASWVLWMSAITGYLIRAVGWQMSFILEGIPSVIWGFVWLLLVRNRPREALWMSVYLAAIILMLSVSHVSDRSSRRKRFVSPFLILSGVALLGSYLAASYTFWFSYGFLILAGSAMYAPYGPFFAIIPRYCRRMRPVR
jgi:sugar phosphate permease